MKRHLEGLYKSFPHSSPQHINILCLFSHREPSVDIHKYSNNENYRFLFTKSFLHVKSIIKVDKVDTLLLFANPGNIFNLFITLLTPTPTHRHQDGNTERDDTTPPAARTSQPGRHVGHVSPSSKLTLQYSILRETSCLRLKVANIFTSGWVDC